MSSWRDYARAIESRPEPCANSVIRAERPLSDHPSPPIGTNGTNGTLPEPIRRGLQLLAESPAPRVRCPELWPQVAADAARLASEGWAAKAIGLGWTALDLFGVACELRGPADNDGLAVKLGGRRVLAICRSFATVADAGGGRTYLYRGNAQATRLLWELGR
jgi:hypothetical protein